MTKEELLALIDSKVNSNGNGEITGASLNEVLKAVAENGGTTKKTFVIEQEDMSATPDIPKEEMDALYESVLNGEDVATIVKITGTLNDMVGTNTGISTKKRMFFEKPIVIGCNLLLEFIIETLGYDHDASFIKDVYENLKSVEMFFSLGGMVISISNFDIQNMEFVDDWVVSPIF